MSKVKVQTDYVKIGVIAKKYDVSTKTVKRWTEKKVIPFLQVENGHYRYDVDDVEKTMKNRHYMRPIQ